MFKQWIKQLGMIALILAISLTSVSAALAQPAQAATDYTVTSPNGTIVVIVTHDTGAGTLTFRATKSGSGVIDSSVLGINTSDGDFSSGLTFGSRTDNTINETYTLPGHKKATYTNNANEMVLHFSKSGKNMDFVVRAYDDGVAFQYRLPGSGSVSISSENSNFNFPDTVDGWAENSSADDQGNWAYRANFNSGSYGQGLLVRESSTWVLLATSGEENYGLSNLSGQSGANLHYNWNSSVAVTGNRPFNTPWRLAEIGSLDTIFQSTMVENLGGTSQIADTSWIEPGVSSWSWWSGDSTTSLSVAESYVDFSASMGWKYYLADDGWKCCTWMPDLITYANGKGVKIIIWVNSSDVDTEAKADAEFSQYANWGAAGVKVDYIWDGGQAKMQEYDMIARKAAQYHLTLNFHGARMPDGLERRWPNLLTREAIYGAEQYKGNTTNGPTAEFNAIIPFTRNVVGPMDYTPITYSDNNNMTTWGHQTALAVVFTSYIQHFADKPSVYNASVAKPFLQAVPAVWDESRLLEGQPGQYVTIARRMGTEWFVGSIVGGNQSRTVSLPLTFLNSGTYTALIYKDGSTDTDIAFQQLTVTNTDTLSIAERVNGGFAIRFVSGTLSTQTPSPTPEPLPSPWQNSDIGTVGQAGSVTYSNGTFTVKGGGADIYDTADAFHYVYQSLSGDGTITARVANFQNTNSWAKAGVMIRETLASNSKHAMMIVSGSSGLAFQWRTTTGGSSSSTAGASVVAPYWVRLTRSGNTFTGYSSSDGVTWTQVGSTTITMASTVYIGLPVTAHDNTTLATATFDNVSATGGISPTATATSTNTPGPTATRTPTPTATSPSGLPSPWQHGDVGAVGVAGNASYSSGTFTVDGSGADIWGTADEFHYVYQSLNGDGTITARVASLENTNTWAKAGVMIRETLNANSTHAMLVITPGNGLAFQRRTSTGGTSSHTSGATATAPYWVRLTRSGNTFTGYASSDGITWTQGGSATISMASSVTIGLAVTSHNDATLATATFDNVSVGSTNLALNKTATASASCNANETPPKAVNGSWTGGTSDKWCDNASTSKWWQVDLGALYTVSKFVIYHAGAGGESTSWNTKDFTIQVSTDGVNWTTVVTVTGNTANTTTNTIPSTSARYVRLNVTAPEQGTGGAARIYEVQVYGP